MEKWVLDQLLEDGVPWSLSVGDNMIRAQARAHTPKGIELVIPRVKHPGSELDHFRPGEFIEARLSHETGIYNIKLQLDKINFERQQIIVVAYVAADLEHLQRRQAFRLKLLLDSKVRATPKSQESHEALIRDLSETGARISVARQVDLPPARSQITCVFDIPALGHMIFKAQIRWTYESGNRCDIGVRFLDLSIEDAERLHKYIWETQIKRIQR